MLAGMPFAFAHVFSALAIGEIATAILVLVAGGESSLCDCRRGVAR